MLNYLKQLFTKNNNIQEGISPEVIKYLENSYPSNHNYTIQSKKLIPHRKLAKRSRVLNSLYPAPLRSLLDLSVCKGYFAFAAANQPTCERVLGIDLYKPHVDVCHTLNDYLGDNRLQFAHMGLPELAARIPEFGGKFQTTLLINMYQYLYFGSDLSSECYLDHDRIFADIRQVCNGYLIFNNRTELAECQNKDQVLQAGDKAKNYTTPAILEAASHYFTVKSESRFGGYPLWVLEAR